MIRRLRLLIRRTAALALLLVFASTAPAGAMTGTRNGALPDPLPLFPADNWWNLDISNWPVDSNSSKYISFINNGGTRRLHPDLGGNAGDPQDPNAIYGMPYAVVTGVANTDLVAVDFLYSDESDGVDHVTDKSFPFYPIPPAAQTQPFWIEGGDPGNVDLTGSQDRHLLIVDADRNYLYELYNVFYDSTLKKWSAGSGAFFDMNTNNRRPDTWTSADAAGLAILPGLIRYDEAYDPSIADIGHAFRVTVRSTNGYVYPASHRAGSTAGALPMGARLRLKASVDVTQRTSDPGAQKIFRAMQKYGLIVADNGSDMYITGTYDTRWDNGILNPAFGALTANDFEVIELGYNASGSTTTDAALAAVSVSPGTVTGGQTSAGVVTLTTAAPAGGLIVDLATGNPAVTLPANVTVNAGATTANFTVTTVPVAAASNATITATYNGVSKSAPLALKPPVFSSLTLNPTSVVGGNSSQGTVTLSGKAPLGGVVVNLVSSKTSRASVPSSVTVPAGASSANFSVTTTAGGKTSATITASYAGVVKKATLAIRR
ncbi:MAG TPA: hypothetical protein VKH64_14190 [Candidatus Binatia bacterium]|nr:hypothetical protein [Candidatus Binatia bacterium]